MPRRTLKVVKLHASRHRLALEEPVDQAADRSLVTDTRNGLQVVRLGRRSPKVTTALVDELCDEVAVIAKHRVRLARQAKAMVKEQANMKR